MRRCDRYIYLSDRHNDRSESGEIFGVAERRIGSGRPGDVDVEAETRAGTALGDRARAREEVPVVVAVDADVEHVRILVEDLLRAVAVVDVLRWSEKYSERKLAPSARGASRVHVTILLVILKRCDEITRKGTRPTKYFLAPNSGPL